MHGAPSPPGIHPFSEPGRGGGAGRQADPRDPRQLRRPQASQRRDWLARHPRWTFHFTPTSCSWANAVEGFFATLTRGACSAASSARSSTCKRHQPLFGEHNRKPKPFVWTADPDRIIEKVNRGHQVIASDHGTGGQRLEFACFPVSAVLCVTIDGIAIPPASTPSPSTARRAAMRFRLRSWSYVGIVLSGERRTLLFRIRPVIRRSHLKLAQACIELVALRYRERLRVGEISKAVGGGETVNCRRRICRREY